MSGERERDLQAQVEALTKERDEALASIRKVQNAAKTIASAHGSELEHLRQNATYDYRLRAEHESLQERDAQMTEALLTAEGEVEALTKERDAAVRLHKAWVDEPNGIKWYIENSQALVVERDALRALLREAADALAELASDVAVSLENEYPSRLRNIYPSMERKYDRDMGPVRRARAVLAKLEAHDATDE